MTEAIASVKPRRKVPVIWFVPIVAALLGIWMVVYNYMNEGPEISITFNTADGIQPGKTKIKALSIELGVVESVEMTTDLNQVLVKAKMERFATPLLMDDTQFWVVRPRIGRGGVSGLETILSGGYIQLEAGTGKIKQRSFEGLEEPPVTPAGAPGLKLILDSGRAASVAAGDPVLFRGYQVGSVETAEFHAKSKRMEYSLFIDEPYDALVNRNTRFWNTSGVTLKAGADGFDVEFGSLETILMGGVAFDLPQDEPPGEPVQDGARFDLFPNRDAINQKHYYNHVDYVVAFEQSVSGLKPGAAVEYRGIKVGTVQRLLITEAAEQNRGYGAPIPVLIRFEPARLGLPDTPAALAGMEKQLEGGVAHGLRANLKTANLLTGEAIIDLNFFPDAGSAELGEFAGYVVIPTVKTGIAGLEQKVGQVLKKLNELPLEPVLQDLSATLVAVRESVENINGALTSKKASAMTASVESALRKLNATLDSVAPDSPTADSLNMALRDLNQTLRNIETLTRKLSDKPNSLIFSTPAGADPVPQQGGSR
jgi:paraquat-inducible protein B